jgi:glucose-6-phosphate-specific signal transduction histidine kinase
LGIVTYFVVAEALTNVAKHARAQRAAVTAGIEDGTLAVHVSDDGVGGARPGGNGLLGLADRLAVFGGRLRVETRPTAAPSSRPPSPSPTRVDRWRADRCPAADAAAATLRRQRRS